MLNVFGQVNINLFKVIIPQLKIEGRKAVLTYRLHTLKDKPSRVNKETKILSKYDAEIHRVNWLKPAILR